MGEETIMTPTPTSSQCQYVRTARVGKTSNSMRITTSCTKPPKYKVEIKGYGGESKLYCGLHFRSMRPLIYRYEPLEV